MLSIRHEAQNIDGHRVGSTVSDEAVRLHVAPLA